MEEPEAEQGRHRRHRAQAHAKIACGILLILDPSITTAGEVAHWVVARISPLETTATADPQPIPPAPVPAPPGQPIPPAPNPPPKPVPIPPAPIR